MDEELASVEARIHSLLEDPLLREDVGPQHRSEDVRRLLGGGVPVCLCLESSTVRSPASSASNARKACC